MRTISGVHSGGMVLCEVIGGSDVQRRFFGFFDFRTMRGKTDQRQAGRPFGPYARPPREHSLGIGPGRSIGAGFKRSRRPGKTLGDMACSPISP